MVYFVILVFSFCYLRHLLIGVAMVRRIRCDDLGHEKPGGEGGVVDKGKVLRFFFLDFLLTLLLWSSLVWADGKS